jgi:hypothetical protein
MCECACGDAQIEKGWRVGENILAVELYRGCKECNAGLLVSLHIFTPEQAEEYEIEIVGEFKPDAHGWAQMPFPVVGKDDLVKAAESLEEEEGDLFEEYGSLPEVLREFGLKLLQKSFAIRQKEIEEGVKR